jgi:hypothetical protein
MFAANAHTIRHADAADDYALTQLAALDSQPAIHRPALIAENDDGRAVAAVSLIDCRVVADPFEWTDHLTPALLLRARVVHALHTTPSLRMRLVAGLRPAY